MVNKNSNKYAELLLEDKISDIDASMEWDRISIVWDRFLNGEQKTIGVENIYPILLDIQNKNEEKYKFVLLKTAFKSLRDYASEGLRTKYANKKIKDVQKYSNENSALRIYSVLELTSMLGGYKPNTWVSQKELSVAGHMSQASVNSTCELLYRERFIEKQQESKGSKTKGSVFHQLNKRGVETLSETDNACRKIDRDVWQGFRKFLSDRIDILYDLKYIENIGKEVTYSLSPTTMFQELIYATKPIEPSRKILGKVGEKILLVNNYDSNLHKIKS